MELLAEAGFSKIQCSSIYETPPWGFEAPNAFLNICFTGYTELSPTRFIDLLIGIEEQLGRIRSDKTQYTSRTLDLDIILWDSLMIHSSKLSIPHPRAHERRFVLAPAAEIEPDWMHPVYNQSLTSLLENCKDESVIEKLSDNF